MSKLFSGFLIALGWVLAAASAQATVISGSLAVDNGYSLYVSTDDSVAGDFIMSKGAWQTTDSFSYQLNAGTDYFLHIEAWDWGLIAGILGDFTLTGGDHVFANGQTSISTNGTDWGVNNTQWGAYTTASVINGSNGVSPWGTRPGISSDAQWIWSSDAYNDNYGYFTLAIKAVSGTSVPEPSVLILFSLGLLGLVAARRRV